MLDDVGVKRILGDSEPAERRAPMHAERPRASGKAAPALRARLRDEPTVVVLPFGGALHFVAG
jgi:hypothetical protein